MASVPVAQKRRSWNIWCWAWSGWISPSKRRQSCGKRGNLYFLCFWRLVPHALLDILQGAVFCWRLMMLLVWLADIYIQWMYIGCWWLCWNTVSMGTLEECISILFGAQAHMHWCMLAWILCWLSCPFSRYVSEETPMQYFLNTHHVLENRRKEAKLKGREGPRVAVLGPVDVGKSSLCKILMNYAIRMDWTPLYVDVDVGESRAGNHSIATEWNRTWAICLWERTNTCR